MKNLAAKSNAFNHLKEYFQEKWGHLPEEAFQMLTDVDSSCAPPLAPPHLCGGAEYPERFLFPY